jgi:DNA-binding YbaB/EbfC family protein
MMKEAQRMQQQMLAAQEELAQRTVEATSGGGKVTVVANGAGDVISLKIAKEVVDPEDVEFLEDLILTAVKKAIEDGKAMSQAEMSKLMPPGMGGLGGLGF